MSPSSCHWPPLQGCSPKPKASLGKMPKRGGVSPHPSLAATKS
jgi:hypothetical protein